MENKGDLIWPDAEVEWSEYRDPFYWINSPRMGGEYLISPYSIVRPIEDERLRARLTTLVIEQRTQGIQVPKVTKEMIEQAAKNSDLPVNTRAIRLLRRITQNMKYIDSAVEIKENGEVTPELLAWAEILSWRELTYLFRYLGAKGWIAIESDNRFEEKYVFQVTVEGHSQLAETVTDVDSTQCFVAMWFIEETDKCYQNSIKPAIEQAGYDAMRIDKKEHVNKIDDEIIAEIRRSLFIVADFTHGEDGVRGGVYYEAGFAYGLSLPVIFTCRSDKIDELHFDTRQYNHIVWEPEKLEQFQRDLYNRILATIGEGPNNG